MEKLLSPDQNKYLLSKFHTSSKLLLPSLCLQYLSNKYEFKKVERIIGTVNILNVGFHSYISTSAIITDYIKPPTVSKIFRITNVSVHSLAILGYMNQYLYKNINL